jgi:hypothetical protein
MMARLQSNSDYREALVDAACAACDAHDAHDDFTAADDGRPLVERLCDDWPGFVGGLFEARQGKAWRVARESSARNRRRRRRAP